MVASVDTADPSLESTVRSSTMSTSYQSRSSVKSYHSKQHGRIYTVDKPSPSSRPSGSTRTTTRQSRFDQTTRPRHTMSVDRDVSQDLYQAQRFMDTSIQSRGRHSLYVDSETEPQRSSRFGYSLDRYSNPAARVDRDSYEQVRHDLRNIKSSRFLNPMRPSSIKRKVEEVYDARSSVAKSYGVPSKSSKIRTSSYESRYAIAPRISRSTSLTRFGNLDLEDEPVRRPKRTSSVTRYESSSTDGAYDVYPRKTYAELGAEYDVRTRDCKVDSDLLNYKDLSATVVDKSGHFSPDEIRVRTLPSGKKAVTFSRMRQSGTGDQVEGDRALQRVIQRTQFMENSMSALEQFIKRNRSLFPEDTRIYQQYTYFMLNEQQLREIGEPPDAEIYGVTIREKLVVPYGTDVTSLLGRYFKKSEIDVEYAGQQQRRGRQITTTETEETDYTAMQTNMRRKVEEEWEIRRQAQLAGYADYQVKSATKHRDMRDSYDHITPHVTPNYIRSIYDGAGARYDDIYKRTRPGYEPAGVSDQEPKRSTKPKKRLDATPSFTTRLASKRCMVQQTIRFNCAVSGLPPPDVTWFHGNKIVTNGGRFRVTNDYGFLTLEISDVAPADAGLYTVKASNLEGEVACSASLDVEGEHESEKGDGTRKPYFLVEPFNAWAEVGAKVVIEAQAAGKPAPTFKWFRDSFPIEDSDRSRIHSDENGNTKLVLKDVQLTDGGLYFCVAENKAGRAKCAATFRVVDKGHERTTRSLSPSTRDREPVPSVPDLPERQQVPKAGRPWFVQLPPQEISLREGDPLTIKSVIDGDPKPVVTWFKGVRELTYSKRHRILCEGQDHYLLQIPSTLQTDPGQYIVCAENPNGKCQANIWVNVLPKDADIDEDTILRTLRLQLPDLDYDITKTKEFAKTPPKFIKKLPLETEVSSGSSFEFCCAVQDDTPIEEIRTTINRKVMEGDYKLIETTHNLSKGTKEAEEIPLGVTEAPKILAPLSDVTINVGGTVRFTLKVNTKVKVTWSRDGQTIQDGGRYKVITEGKTLILEVTDITAADAGSYGVTISNDQGSASASCSLIVLGGTADIVTTDQVKAVVESQVEQVFQDAMLEVGSKLEPQVTDVVSEEAQAEVTIDIAQGAAVTEAASVETQDTVEAQITLATEEATAEIAQAEVTAQAEDTVEAQITLTTEEATAEIAQAEVTAQAEDTVEAQITLATEAAQAEVTTEAEDTVEAQITLTTEEATAEIAQAEVTAQAEDTVEAQITLTTEEATAEIAQAEVTAQAEDTVEAQITLTTEEATAEIAQAEVTAQAEDTVEAQITLATEAAQAEVTAEAEDTVEAQITLTTEAATAEAEVTAEAEETIETQITLTTEAATTEVTAEEAAVEETLKVEVAPTEEAPIEEVQAAPAAAAPTEEDKGYRKIDEEESTTEATTTGKTEESEASESTEVTTESSEATSSAAVSAKDDKDAGDKQPLIEAAAPVEEKPAEVAPVEEKPAEVAPVEEKPAEVAPVEEKPAEVAPVEEKPAEVAPVEEKPAEVAPVEEKPAEVAPVEEKPAEVAPVEEKPVEVAPVEEKPAEVAPVEEKPAEVAPVAEKPVEEAPSETMPKVETQKEESSVSESVSESKTETTSKTEPSKPADEADAPKPVEAEIAPVEEKPVEADIVEKAHSPPIAAGPEEKPVESDEEELVTTESEEPEKPADLKAVDEMPIEADVVKKVEEKPEEPAEEKPVEVAPVEEKPAEVAPVEEKPAEVAPVEEKPAEVAPVEEKPAEVAPVEEKPTEVAPVEEKPAEVAPVEEKPAEAAPVEEKPAEAAPVGKKPAEDKPDAKAESEPSSVSESVTESESASVTESVSKTESEAKPEQKPQPTEEPQEEVKPETEEKAKVQPKEEEPSVTESVTESVTASETEPSKTETKSEEPSKPSEAEAAVVISEETVQVQAAVSAEASVEVTTEESAEVTIQQTVETKVEKSVEARVEESVEVSAAVSVDAANAEIEVKQADVADAAAAITTESTVEESAEVSIEVTEKTAEATTESVTATTETTAESSEVTTSDVSASAEKPVEEKVEAPVTEKPAEEKPTEKKPGKKAPVEEPSESSEADSSTAATSTEASTSKAEKSSEVKVEETVEAQIVVQETETKIEVQETAEAETKIEVQETVEAEAKIEVQETVEAEAKIEVQETVEAEAKIEVQETAEAEAKIEVQETVEAEAKIEVQETVEAEAKIEVQASTEAEATLEVEQTVEAAAGAEATLQVEQTAEAEAQIQVAQVEETVEVEEKVEVKETAEEVKVEVKIEKKKKKVKLDTEEGEVDTMDEVSENLESYASEVEEVEGGEELDESESTVSAEATSSSESSGSSTESKTETKSAEIAGTKVSFVHSAKAEEVVVETFEEASARLGGDQVDAQEVIAAFQAAEAEIQASQARAEEEKVEMTINVTTKKETIEFKTIDEAKQKAQQLGGKIILKKFIIRLDGSREELMEAELVDGDEDMEVGRLIMLGPGENTEEALERVRADVVNVVGMQKVVIRRVIVIRGDEPEADIIAHLKSEGVDENALARLQQEIAKVRVRTVVRRIIVTGEGFDEELLEQLRVKLVDAGGTGKVTVSKLVLSIDDSDDDLRAKLKAESLDDKQTLVKMKAELEKARADSQSVVMKIVIQGEGLDDAAFARIKMVIATFGGEKETKVTTRKFVVTGEETDEELTQRMIEEGLDEATMEKIRADLAYARLQSHLVRRVVIHGDGVDDENFEKLKIRLSAVQGQGNVTVKKLVLKVDEPEENIRNTLKNENFDDPRIGKMLQELAEAKGEGKTMIMKIIILGEGVKDEDFERIKEELANFGSEVEARVHRTLTRRIIIHGEGMDDEGIEKLRSALANAAGAGSITVTKLELNVADSEEVTVSKIKAEGLDDNTVAKMKAELEEAKEDGEDRLLKIIIQGQDLDDDAFGRIKTEIRNFGGESEGAMVVRKIIVKGGHGMDQDTLDQIRAQLAEGCSGGKIVIKRVVRDDADDSDTEAEEEEIEVSRVTEVKEVTVKEVEGQQQEQVKEYTVDKSADVLTKEMLEGDFDSKEVVKKVNVVRETFTGEQDGMITKTTRIITTTISTGPDGSVRKETKTEVHTETQDAGEWTEDSEEDSEMDTETESRTESKKGAAARGSD